MKIIERAIALNEFTRLEDGFLYYFPSGTGGISSEHLREIAEYLERENKEVQDTIDSFFAMKRAIRDDIMHNEY